MFRNLTDFPRCRIDVTLLSDRPPYAVRIVDRTTGESKDYAVEELDPPFGTIEAMKFTHGATEYALMTSTDGEHYCSCPSFVHSRENVPCRHLAASFRTGILRMDLVPYLLPLMERIKTL